jgi:hypothetical protein
VTAAEPVPEVIERYWDALTRENFDAAAACLHGSFIEDWPQSGERIVGAENWLGMVTRHPTFPAVTVRSHTGEGSLWVSQAHFEYPTDDGSAPYEVCAVQRVAEGRIASIVEYFAAPFEAADWRADLVERVT